MRRRSAARALQPALALREPVGHVPDDVRRDKDKHEQCVGLSLRAVDTHWVKLLKWAGASELSRCHDGAGPARAAIVHSMLPSSSAFAALVVTLTFLIVLTAGVFAGVYRGVLSRRRAALLLVLVGILTAALSAVLIGGKQ